MFDSIYKNTNNNLKDILVSYQPSEILYVPIDVAKYNHSAFIVNLFGEVIIPKFDFPYNNNGLDFFRNKLNIALQKTQAKRFFFALESTGHYHENLVASLLALGYDIAVIRPIDAKNEKEIMFTLKLMPLTWPPSLRLSCLTKVKEATYQILSTTISNELPEPTGN